MNPDRASKAGGVVRRLDGGEGRLVTKKEERMNWDKGWTAEDRAQIMKTSELNLLRGMVGEWRR